MSGLQLLISIVVSCLILSKSEEFECTKTITGSVSGTVEVTGIYDLCDFVVGSNTQDGWYAVNDNRTTVNEEDGGDTNLYIYYFNIASNIAKPTPDVECDNYTVALRNKIGSPGWCKDIISPGQSNSTCKGGNNLGDPNIVPITNFVGAYQAKKGSNENNQKCWRLHDGNASSMYWEFIDVDDPALGIQLVYVNGDYCQGYGKNREFKMKFWCSNEIHLTPDYVETIFEPIGKGCSYEFHMKTFKGCPTECMVDNEEVCSGHGVCDYDWQRGAPKCFCYNGWYGEDCHDTADPNEEIIYQDSDNSYVGALVFVILLLLVILFILGYLFLRYTRLQNHVDFKFVNKAKGKQGKRQKGVDEYDEE